MDDLLTQHAERVTASNAAHERTLHAVRDAVDEALREQIAAFGAKLVEASAIVSDACHALLTSLDRIVGDAAAESGAAFGSNLAEIAASGAAMHAEMRDRATFMATGTLPARDPLPNTAEAPRLTVLDAAE